MMFNIFLFFLLINSFYVIYPLNSSMLAALLVFLLGGMLKPRFLENVRSIVLSKDIAVLVCFLFGLSFLNLLIITLHGAFDFSYLFNYISQLLQLFLSIVVVAFVLEKVNLKGLTYVQYVSRLIVWTFIIQSIIQALAFMFPVVTKLVHMTYTESQLASVWSEYYRYARGLALSGSAGWSLTVGYGLAFLFFIKEYVISQKLNFISVIMFLLLILGTFFAGRSGFLGLILASLYFLFWGGSVARKFSVITTGFFWTFFTVIVFYLIMPSFWEQLVERSFPFVFEAIYKYQETGALETSSTTVLLDMWNVPIDTNTFLFGDGLFTDPHTGYYYKGTDVGYLRNILFGGFLWVFWVALYNFFLISGNKLLCKNFPKKEKIFIFFVLMYTMLLEVKAMTIGFNKYLFTIMVLYLIATFFDCRKQPLKGNCYE